MRVNPSCLCCMPCSMKPLGLCMYVYLYIYMQTYVVAATLLNACFFTNLSSILASIGFVFCQTPKSYFSARGGRLAGQMGKAVLAVGCMIMELWLHRGWWLIAEAAGLVLDCMFLWLGSAPASWKEWEAERCYARGGGRQQPRLRQRA